MSQFVLVLGHRADEIREFVDKAFRGIRVTYVINDRYRETNTGYSLMLAAKAIGTAEFVKFDADVVFDVKILRQLWTATTQTSCVSTATSRLRTKKLRSSQTIRCRSLRLASPSIPSARWVNLSALKRSAPERVHCCSQSFQK